MQPSAAGFFPIHLIRLSFIALSKASIFLGTSTGIISFLQVLLLWVGVGKHLPVWWKRGSRPALLEAVLPASWLVNSTLFVLGC